MRTEYRPNDSKTDTRSTRRCFRHSVWMAYCSDCRDAHAPLLRKHRKTEAANPRR